MRVLTEDEGGLQGSPSWLDWRKTIVTSSDASVIMGRNPFCDIEKLIMRKCGLIPPEPENEAMRRGSRLEEEARSLFVKEINLNIEPAVCVNEKYPFAGTSLDGISDCRNLIIEIKCPVKINKHLALLDDDGCIPFHYQDQIQHHLFVSEASVCYFISYHPDAHEDTKIIVKEVMPDLEWQQIMINKERDFFDNYIKV